jgi:hypothetical protein
MKMKRKMSLEVVSTETDSVKVGDKFTVSVGLIETPTIKGNKLDGTGDEPNKPRGPKKPKQPSLRELVLNLVKEFHEFKAEMVEFKKEMNEFKVEVNNRLDKIENTLARHEAKLNEIDEFKVEVRGVFERNNLK